MAAARWGAAATAILTMVFGGCEQEGSSDGSASGGGTSGATADGTTYSGGSTNPAPAASGGTGGSAPNGSTFTLRPKSLVAKVDMSGIAECVKAFQINMDRFPTNDEGLDVLVSPDRLESGKDKWQGPYVDSRDVLVDTYGNSLEYESTGSGFILRSLGADGERGGSGSSADIELRN